jgi:prephenate dehydratase
MNVTFEYSPAQSGVFYFETMSNKLKTVGIQGVHGAFHEIAARNFFTNEIEVIACNTFDDIARMVSNKEIDCGIMAIENTVAGSLMPNYALLRENPIKVIGEQYIRIKQNLMALPGQSIKDIKEVHSHYMAIAQTRKFFDQHPHITLLSQLIQL